MSVEGNLETAEQHVAGGHFQDQRVQPVDQQQFVIGRLALDAHREIRGHLGRVGDHRGHRQRRLLEMRRPAWDRYRARPCRPDAGNAPNAALTAGRATPPPPRRAPGKSPGGYVPDRRGAPPQQRRWSAPRRAPAGGNPAQERAWPRNPDGREIAFAGQKKIVETFRTAEGVDPLQQLDHRAGTQLEGAVHLAVLAGDRDGQVATVDRHADALAQRAHQFDARGFVTVVRGPEFGRVTPLPRSCVSAAKRTGRLHPWRAAQSMTRMMCSPVSISGWCSGG